MSRSQARSEAPSGTGHRDGLVSRRSRWFWRGCALLLLLGVCTFNGLRLNLSGSMPVGLYMVVREPPVRGSIVLACLPMDVAQLAMARSYVPRGGSCPGGAIPVGKPVLAVPGDTVLVSTAGLILNGAPVPNSRALTVDRMGRRLPCLAPGQRTVGSDELWLVSAYTQNSFDSRYFGPVALRDVRAHVRPLWTSGLPRRF